MTPTGCRAAVLGSPIRHSLSPVLHRAAYARLGIEWTYDAIEVTAEQLAGFVAGCGPEWAGLSLTMPLKEAVLPLLDEVSQLARVTRAANTVCFTHAGRVGDNTDVAGIRWALLHDGALAAGAKPASATVVGAGATARSAVAALAGLGAEQIAVLARRPEAVAQLAEVADHFGVQVDAAPWSEPQVALAADVVISTLPAGAADHLAAALPPKPAVLLDVVYSPWPSVLGQSWRSRGGAAVGGLDMLVGQAAEQVRLMTGRNAPIEVMLAAGRSAAAAGN